LTSWGLSDSNASTDRQTGNPDAPSANAFIARCQGLALIGANSRKPVIF
jgi:hypothetical protein